MASHKETGEGMKNDKLNDFLYGLFIGMWLWVVVVIFLLVLMVSSGMVNNPACGVSLAC